MDRDHKIRIAVSHLKGEARHAEMVRLLADKEYFTRRLAVKLMLIRRGKTTRSLR